MNFVQNINPPTPNSVGMNLPGNAANLDYQNPGNNLSFISEQAQTFGLNYGRTALAVTTLSQAAADYFINGKKMNFASFLSGDDLILPEVGRSDLGTPVLSNLIIKAGKAYDSDGVIISEWPDIRMDVVLIETEAQKNAVITNIQGRDGDIVEYLSARSLRFHITGQFLSKTAGGYPYTKTQDLFYALQANKSLKIESWYLNMFGVYNLFTMNAKFPQPQGEGERQFFEFDAIQDKPVILRLQK